MDRCPVHSHPLLIMLLIAGCATVVFCVFGGYVLNNGHVAVLWQPFEFLIILGAAAGGYIIANTKVIPGQTGKELGHLMKGPKYAKEHYLELPPLLFQVFKIAKTVADGVPALGIVLVVLGVIYTMGSITEPPEVLGHLIGGALVGTFAGAFIAYGFVGPIAHLGGFAPAISVEYARKILPTELRTGFTEVEEAAAALPPA